MAFRTRQLSEFLGISQYKLRKLAERGKLKGYKHADGYHWLYEKEDVAKFILSNFDIYQNFCTCKPRKIYQDSYNILLKEVYKQSGWDFKENS